MQVNKFSRVVHKSCQNKEQVVTAFTATSTRAENKPSSSTT